jgi:hypothetical protein
MSEGKMIGERIWFDRTKSHLEVVITQRVEFWKELLLILWLIGWLFCGIVFVYFLNQAEFQSQRVFLFVSLGFWAFFMFRISRVFFWRRIGKELINVGDGKITIRNQIGRFGKVQTYNLQHVKNIGLVKFSDRNFLQFMDQSFWIIGGDKLGFSYMSKKYQFGKQLNEKDYRALLFVVEKAIRSFSK